MANPKPSIEEGASTSLVAAFDPALNGKKSLRNLLGRLVLTSRLEREILYLSDCQPANAESHATDVEKAKKLWALSEELVEEKF